MTTNNLETLVTDITLEDLALTLGARRVNKLLEEGKSREAQILGNQLKEQRNAMLRKVHQVMASNDRAAIESILGKCA
jgi:hypothetical protein